MALERIFLILAAGGAAAYALVALTFGLTLGWLGIPVVLLVVFAAYVAWRLIAGHVSDREDRYYEDRFDR